LGRRPARRRSGYEWFWRPCRATVLEKMVADLGGKGDLLVLAYRTGEVCRNREVLLDQIVAKSPEIKVTKKRSSHSRIFEDGAQYPTLGLRPIRRRRQSRIWGCWDDPAIGAIGSLRQQGRDE